MLRAGIRKWRRRRRRYLSRKRKLLTRAAIPINNHGVFVTAVTLYGLGAGKPALSFTGHEHTRGRQFFKNHPKHQGVSATVQVTGNETDYSRVRGISLVVRSERLPGSRDCNSGSKSKKSESPQACGGSDKTGYESCDEHRQVTPPLNFLPRQYKPLVSASENRRPPHQRALIDSWCRSLPRPLPVYQPTKPSAKPSRKLPEGKRMTASLKRVRLKKGLTVPSLRLALTPHA